MNDCIFCKIVKKEIPSTAVYENEFVYAFRDIHPQAKHHILLVPKQHVASVMDTDTNSNMLQHVFDAVKEISKKEKIDASGFRVVVNNGPNAGQTVFHLHFHILGGERLSDRMV
jgi:histidine triad (HIT) family protein